MRNLFAAGSLALLLAGCLSLTRPVPSTWDHTTAPSCTSHYGWVAGDAALAALATGVGLTVADRSSDRTTSQTAAVAGGVVGLGFAIAAGLGSERVDDCQRANESLRAVHAAAQ